MKVMLVVLGSFRHVEAQTTRTRDLARAHGFEGIENRSMNSWTWIERDSQAFVCNHVAFVGRGDGRRFRAEALQLAGVYTKCPECVKRSF